VKTLATIALPAVLIALVVAIAQIETRDARAGTDTTHKVYSGYVPSGAVVTTGWHPPGGTEDGLDISKTGNPSGSSIDVNLLSEHLDGSDTLKGYRQASTSSNDCTGWEYVLKDGDLNIVGKLRYIHIEPETSAPTTYTFNNNSGYTAATIGYVLADETTDCKNAGSWSNPHLHQSESGVAPASTHTAIDEDDSIPYGNSNSWMFEYSVN
jgi:hypothetical protein